MKKCLRKGCKATPVFIDPWHYCPEHGIIWPKDWNHHFQGWYRT